MPYTLVTAATSSRAHKIKSIITEQDVILGDYADLPDFMVKPGKLIRIPNPLSVSYAHEMLTLCLDNDINTIYPLNFNEAELLLEAAQLFIEFNINIIKPDEIQ
ncbi:MAG: hypothetical protein EOP47_24750 [Sphingobacteriaceae bacterium]|nr:MAG: hypothetical protein EOP47_24750 [Sphingobacteriaceae bacterium]